jgi:hypothetical protein
VKVAILAVPLLVQTVVQTAVHTRALFASR